MHVIRSLVVCLVVYPALAAEIPTDAELDQALTNVRRAESHRFTAQAAELRKQLPGAVKNKAAELQARIQYYEVMAVKVLDPQEAWAPVRGDILKVKQGDIFEFELAQSPLVEQVLDATSALLKLPPEAYGELIVISNIDAAKLTQGKPVGRLPRVYALGSRKVGSQTYWDLRAIKRK